METQEDYNTDYKADTIEQDYAAPENFRCDSLAKAMWTGEKLARVLKRQSDIKNAADERIRKVQEWATRETGRLARDVQYFTGLLEDYARTQNDTDPKIKSIVLPDCVLRLRKMPDRYERDETIMLEWVRKNAMTAYEKITSSLNWLAMKDAAARTETGDLVLIATGEVIPGVKVTPGEVEFSIRPNKED